jgi:hypothetical protein
MEAWIENTMLELIGELEVNISRDRVGDARKLTLAGEPGITLENLCTQLSEYDMPVSHSHFAIIQRLGNTMRISPTYWQRLIQLEK